MSVQISAISEIARLVHGEGDFVLFKSYMDESGIHGGSRICVVAGFVAHEKYCIDLEYAWKEPLKRHRITVFHSKEFAPMKGEFDGWIRRQKEDFVIDALATIARVMSGSTPGKMIGAAIKTATFSSFSIEQRRWLTGGRIKPNGKWLESGAPSKPYFLPFQQCVVDATLSSDERGLTHFIFDQQKDFEPNAKKIFALMNQQHPAVSSRLGDIVYTSKRRAVLLQLADFVAYESYQYLVVNRPKAPLDYTQRSDSHPLFSRNSLTTEIGAADINRMLKENPIVPGKHFSWPIRATGKERRGKIPLGRKVVKFPK